MNNSIEERLSSLVGKMGKNEFARKCGIKPSTMLGYLNGTSPPSIENLKKIAQACEVTVGWLAAGEYPKEPDLLATLEEADAYKHKKKQLKYLASFTEPEGIPVCPTCGSDFAGHIVQVHSTVGAGPEEEWKPEPICRVCIPQRFHLQDLLVIRVEGDSMDPTIREGAFVGIDTSKKEIIAGKVYAIRVPYEGVTLKKVFVDPEEQCLRLKSDNPDHPEQKLHPEQGGDPVVGKAAWVMQEI